MTEVKILPYRPPAKFRHIKRPKDSTVRYIDLESHKITQTSCPGPAN